MAAGPERITCHGESCVFLGETEPCHLATSESGQALARFPARALLVNFPLGALGRPWVRQSSPVTMSPRRTSMKRSSRCRRRCEPPRDAAFGSCAEGRPADVDQGPQDGNFRIGLADGVDVGCCGTREYAKKCATGKGTTSTVCRQHRRPGARSGSHPSMAPSVCVALPRERRHNVRRGVASIGAR
jgi:hypothetical protein